MKAGKSEGPKDEAEPSYALARHEEQTKRLSVTTTVATLDRLSLGRTTKSPNPSECLEWLGCEVAMEELRDVQPPYAENGTYGGVGGVTGAIP